MPVSRKVKPTSPDGSPEQANPSESLDHLKVRVPQAMIRTMKACLNRNPKERATIPDLLSQDWLTMRERTELPQGKHLP